MGLEASLRELPPEFVVRRGGRGVLAVRADLEAALAAEGLTPDGGGGRPSELAGRGPLRELEAAGRRFVLRPFRHGGLLRWLTRERFADPARPFRELCLAHALAAAGIATPAVVGARAVRAGALGWRLALVSERVPAARDLGLALEQAREGGLARAERSRLARAAGELVGRLHALGLWHADLQPRNLLEGGEPARLWVIDLEGSVLGPLDDARRRANLRRLWRAARRREARGRSFLARGDWARFLRAYGAACGRSWRDEARALAGEAPGLGHRLGWWLEERWGAPERRDGPAAVRRSR